MEPTPAIADRDSAGGLDGSAGEPRESELVDRIRRGDERAFEQLYDRFAPGILGYCRHMLGSREDAEEAAQSSFLSAFKSLTADSREIDLKPWLYTIARNRCLSMLRSRRDIPSDEIEISTGDLNPEVERRAELRELLGDLQQLPHRQREALLLTELRELSQAEIATIMDCSVGQVKGLVYRARSALIDRREAREVDCAEVREELATAVGGTFRKNRLVQHLLVCQDCTRFREQLRSQHRMLGVALPVVPGLALYDGVMSGITGTAAGAASAAGIAGAGSSAGGAAVGGSAATGASAGIGAGASAGAGAGTAGGIAAGGAGAAAGGAAAGGAAAGAGGGAAAAGGVAAGSGVLASVAGALGSGAAKVAVVAVLGGAAAAGANEVARDPGNDLLQPGAGSAASAGPVAGPESGAGAGSSGPATKAERAAERLRGRARARSAGENRAGANGTQSGRPGSAPGHGGARGRGAPGSAGAQAQAPGSTAPARSGPPQPAGAGRGPSSGPASGTGQGSGPASGQGVSAGRPGGGGSSAGSVGRNLQRPQSGPSKGQSGSPAPSSAAGSSPGGNSTSSGSSTQAGSAGQVQTKPDGIESKRSPGAGSADGQVAGSGGG